MTCKHKLISAALFAVACSALSGCGGGKAPATMQGGGNGQPVAQPAKPGAFDPARAEIMYGVVTRSASGLPTGVKLTWATQPDAVSYNVYRSNAAIPDTARGDAALQIATAIAVNVEIDNFGGTPPLIGQTWFYRISAVDSDGDESRLSPQLQVDITAHFSTALDKATAAVGDTATITGQNFGIFNAATDSVTAPGVVWQTTAPVGFQPAQVPCPIVSWNATVIVVTMPLGWTQGPLSVVIAGTTANTPTPIANTDPYITSLLPVSADVTQTVTLLGNNFGAVQDAAHFVHFGPLDLATAASYTSYANTQIQFTPPNLRQFTSQQVYVSAAARTSNLGFCDLANAPPVVSVVADKTSGYSTLTVNFDASASSDPEGTALTFDWDFNGDGSYDLLGTGSTASFTFTIGTYSVIVRAHDADGGAGTLAPPLTITVQPSLAGPWFMFGHDETHSHRSTVNGPQASAFPRRIYNTSGVAVRSSVAFAADGTSYCAAQTGQLYAFNPDGTTKWKAPVSGGFAASPAVGPNGTIYVGDAKGDFYAYNATDGSVKWKFATGTGIASSAAIDPNGLIYFGSNNGLLTALRDDGPNTPFKLWQQTLGGGLPIRSSPALGSDGTVYVGCDDGLLYAFKADGSPKWTFSTGVGNTITSSPAIGTGGQIYFGCSNTQFYSLKDNGPSAQQKWATSLIGNIAASPAVMGNGFIVIGSDAGVLYLIQDQGGSALFKGQFPAAGNLSPFTSSACVGADSKIYVGNDNGIVYCLNGTTMAQIWQYDSGAPPVLSSPAIGPDGALYVGDKTGLLALGITNPRPPVVVDNVPITETGLNFTLSFNASPPQTFSPDGAKLLKYDWDFNGDGTIDLPNGGPVQSHSYPAPGMEYPHVLVTDDNGQVGDSLGAVCKIWSAVPLDLGVKVCRLAEVGGNPAIAYINISTGTPIVTVRRAVDAKGNDWSLDGVPVFSSNQLQVAPEALDLVETAPGSPVSPASAGVVFAYSPSPSFPPPPDLVFMHSTDNGQTWSGPTTITTLNSSSGVSDVSLAMVNGKPAVAYVDVQTRTTSYAHASAADGSAWLPPVNLGGAGSAKCDLTVIGGHPAVIASTGISALYWRSLDADGVAWPTSSPTTVMSTSYPYIDNALTELSDPVSGLTVPGAVGLASAGTFQDGLYSRGSDLNFGGEFGPFSSFSSTLGDHIDLCTVNMLPCVARGEKATLSTMLFFRGADDFSADASGSYFGSTIPNYVTLLTGANPGTSLSVAQVDKAAATAYVMNGDNLYFSAEPNAAPRAFLSADVLTGTAPLTVNFDATHSFDPEGSISSVVWNLSDARGQFNDMNLNQQATYNTPGTYVDFVVLVDDKGQTAGASVTIVVN